MNTVTLVISSLAVSALLFVGACAADLDMEAPPSCDNDQCDRQSRRFDYASLIRDEAAAGGLTNGALLAGIAEVETRLTHCYNPAETWTCPGPVSPSCGGRPVIAGGADGPCKEKKGGLGMFQFDAGTFADTLRRDGQEILTVEGNVRAAVPFLPERAISHFESISSEEEALAWMNSIELVDGNPELEKWSRFAAARYNGCTRKSARCTEQARLYKMGVLDLYDEFGPEFWEAFADGS